MRLNTDRLLLEARRSRKGLLLLILVFMIAAIPAAIIFKNLTFERPFADYSIVRVAFDDVKGVVTNKTQVRLKGVQIGVLSDVELVNGEPVLDLRIEREFAPIYRDAEARLRPVTPLQDIYVNITDRGTEAAGVATEKNIVPAKNTVSPVDVSRVLNTFNADTRERLTLLFSQIEPALGDDGGRKLRAAFGELAPFLHVAEDTTRVLAERRTQLRRLVDNFGKVSAALATRDEQVSQLVTEGNSTLAELTENDVALDSTLAEIPSLLQSMGSGLTSLHALSDELDPTLRGLQPVAEHLEPGLAALSTFGEDTLPALRALRPAFRDLRPMARALVPTSRSLQTSFTRLRPRAVQLDSLTSELPRCLTELQNFFQDTPSVAKFADGTGAAYPRAEMTVDLDGIGFGEIPTPTTKPLPRCVNEEK